MAVLLLLDGFTYLLGTSLHLVLIAYKIAKVISSKVK